MFLTEAKAEGTSKMQVSLTLQEKLHASQIIEYQH